MSAQDLCDKILSDVVEGEVGADEGLYALANLSEYAKANNDVAAQELFDHTHATILAECEEVDEADDRDAP